MPGFVCCGAGQELCRGAGAAAAHGPSERSRASAAPFSECRQSAGLSSLIIAAPAKQTLCNQRHGPCISSREPGGVRGVQSTEPPACPAHGDGRESPAPLCPEPSLLPGLRCSPPQEGPYYPPEAKEPKGNLSPVPGTCQGMNEYCLCPWAALKGRL